MTKRNKVGDVLLEHGGLPHVLPLAIHLELFMLAGLSRSSRVSFTLWVFVWDPSFMLKSCGVGSGWWVAYRILVSAQALSH